MHTPILPGTALADGRQPVLGVVGGGQLGRMFVQAAQRMGYSTVVLDPDADGPAAQVSNAHIAAAYDDAQGLAALAAQAVAVTTEFENVPALSLDMLAAQRPVAPSGSCVAIAQDRRVEKAKLAEMGQSSGIGPVPYAVIEKAIDITLVPDNCLPGVLKTATLGYDGKGQVKVSTRAQLSIAWKQLKGVPCVLEQFAPLAAECSVIVARGFDGQMVTLPVARNTHVNGILAVSEVFEGNLPKTVVEHAQAATKYIAQALGYVGVLCVEFFILKDAQGGVSDASPLAVNEMAPRPHNSGHWSQDGCSLSQFALQVRTLCSLPLPEPRATSATIMLNVLGDSWFVHGGDTAQSPDWAAVLALPGTHVHLYGKQEARRARKMGHVNITAATAAQARAVAQQAAQILGVPFAAAGAA
jgi:5-(carboxyamino)imidazole ribonucleotide synthase